MTEGDSRMDEKKKRCGNRKDGNQEQKPTDTFYFMLGEYSEPRSGRPPRHGACSSRST